ncbi:MAG TPA: TerC/Alx family metal homeostasis membrane protein [Candidatus Acidoferrales bacterium]|nr:TerC/Alx family metal homeostasis membrane protein [Candidatus Acidoferrales bacterium]
MASRGLWIGFAAGLLLLVVVDLIAFGRKPRTISLRRSAAWSAVWIGVSLAFDLWIWHYAGARPAIEFLSGYLVEKSLSVDNLFVFILIFQYFSLEPARQHRVLVWGIFGALTLRGLLIAAGAVFINAFSWSLYILGAFLVYVALHLLFRKSKTIRMEASPVLRWLGKIVPTAQNDASANFFVRGNGRWLVTPMLLAVVAIESADVLFALDSIPAVFGITRDPFIVFSSNACAILGLRALYFVVAKWITQLRYLDTGVSLVLLFIGLKMLAAHWVEIPSGLSLAVIAFLLVAATVASLLNKRGTVEPDAKRANLGRKA